MLEDCHCFDCATEVRISETLSNSYEMGQWASFMPYLDSAHIESIVALFSFVVDKIQRLTFDREIIL
jgi:hypothetical protein